MHNYQATVCQSVPKLVNLTDSTIQVYSSDGAIMTYNPKKNKLPAYKRDAFYVVDRKTYESAIDDGRLTIDLVLIEGISQGRGGIDIASLRLYDDPKIRVYPVYSRTTE